VNKSQKAIIASLIGTSAIAWIASIEQPDMMFAMTTYNPLAISLFTASWTAGMAAMMFPAITPMVMLYSRFVFNNSKEGGGGSGVGRNPGSITVQDDESNNNDDGPRLSSSFSVRSLRVALFIGCYLLVWALTGAGLLLGWSVVMNSTIMNSAGNPQLLPSIYGALLIMAGAYQFTPLKRTCIGYCESPLSFFMRRWKDGTFGAVKMGLWHGLYCLGCCWPYFLLMVALGWMNLLWMGLFAAIIFGEKMWSRGIWVARAAGIGLAIVGILVIAGMLPSLASSTASSMNDGGGAADDEMGSSSGDGGTTSMTNDDNNNNSEGSIQMRGDDSTAPSSNSNLAAPAQESTATMSDMKEMPLSSS